MKIIIEPYNPDWPEKFNAEKERLLPILGNVAIEHIGSTSVPGLAAKPTIDIWST